MSDPSGSSKGRINLLVRDPNCLYVCWDISGGIKEEFLRSFGPDVWDKSVSSIKIFNATRNYTFFMNADEQSGSLFIPVEANCTYVAELGRRVAQDFFVSLAASNMAVTPGNKVSEDKNVFFVDFQEVKGKPIVIRAGSICDNSLLDFGASLQGPSSPGLPDTDRKKGCENSSGEEFEAGLTHKSTRKD